jgi:hypothetical protein
MISPRRKPLGSRQESKTGMRVCSASLGDEMVYVGTRRSELTVVGVEGDNQLERDEQHIQSSKEQSDTPSAETRTGFRRGDPSCDSTSHGLLRIIMPTPPSKRTAPTPVLARGSTARSAASPRLPPQNPSNHRRAASRHGHPTSAGNPDAHEALAASLKQETDEKERVGSHLYISNFDQNLRSSFLYSSRITNSC